MKSKCIFVILIFLLFLSIHADPAKKDKKDWYTFVLQEKMDLNSLANIGRLILDPPAGKHGFLKVNDLSFVFENGTPAKFWGTTLGKSVCFPSKKQAETIANRLAFFGFNAVLDTTV